MTVEGRLKEAVNLPQDKVLRAWCVLVSSYIGEAVPEPSLVGDRECQGLNLVWFCLSVLFVCLQGGHLNLICV